MLYDARRGRKLHIAFAASKRCASDEREWRCPTKSLMCDALNFIGLISDVQVVFLRAPAPAVCSLSSFFSSHVVADLQYADFDDGTNYDGSETRFFRATLESCRKACEFWREIGASDAIHLGYASARPLVSLRAGSSGGVTRRSDLIDGRMNPARLRGHQAIFLPR